MTQAPERSQTGFFDDAERVVRPLCESLRELVGPPDADRPGLAINPTLRSRVTRGIESGHLPSILFHLPGPEGLRRVLSASKRAGARPELIEQCRRRIDEYERFLRAEDVSRDALHAMVRDLAPEAHAAVVRNNAQAVHKAMANLLGYRAEIMLASVLILPGREPGRCDMAQVAGFVGLQRLRTSASFMTSGYGRTEGEAAAPRTLSGDPVDERGPATLLTPFCSEPLPRFEIRQYGRRRVCRLTDDEVSLRSSSTFFFGERVDGAYADPPEPAGESAARAMISAIIATPSKRLHFDVFIHRAAWAGARVHLDTFRTVPHGPADELTLAEREADRIDLGATLQRFDTPRAALGSSRVPRYADLMTSSIGQLGVDPEDFRVYRCEMIYPLHGTQIAMRFEGE